MTTGSIAMRFLTLLAVAASFPTAVFADTPDPQPVRDESTLPYVEVLRRAAAGETFLLAVRTTEPQPRPLGYHTAGPYSCDDAPKGVASGWYWCTRDRAGNAQWQYLSGKPAREVPASRPFVPSGSTRPTTVPPAAGLSTSWNGATLTAPIPIVVPWTVQRGSTNCPASG